jgi:hypothetical protein
MTPLKNSIAAWSPKDKWGFEGFTPSDSSSAAVCVQYVYKKGNKFGAARRWLYQFSVPPLAT